MTRILTTIHLSNIQKEVLAKIKASPNSHMAWEIIQNVEDEVDNNFATARDTLGNLGLLYLGDNEIEITDTGLELMTKENITDESGELTDVGIQLADNNRDEVPNRQMQPASNDGMEDDFGGTDDDFGGTDDELGGFPTESFNLMQSINTQATILEDQKKFKK